jgi:hypothetical protein
VRNDDQRREQISRRKREQPAQARDCKLRVQQDSSNQVADEHDGVERREERIELR